MKNYCSLCGNIYHNTIFKGGYICEDCIEYRKILNHNCNNTADTQLNKISKHAPA